jgi:GST-like protein
MLDLYTWHTPNGKKPGIMLAELELSYRLHLVDLRKGEQKRAAFLALNPNGKIPALVDRDPALGQVVTFESGAILVYLAEKYGRLLPPDRGAKRSDVLAWTFWQVGGPGPTFGQLGKFGRQTPRNEEAFRGFLEESKRLAGVIDVRLADRAFICDEYSIADIACYPWFATVAEKFPEVVDERKALKRWLKRVGSRPAVKRGEQFETARQNGTRAIAAHAHR